MPDHVPSPDPVAADHLYLEAIRAGRAPSEPDQLAGWLLAWRAEVERDIHASYTRNRAELLGPRDPAAEALPAIRPAVVDYQGFRDYAVYSRAEQARSHPLDLPTPSRDLAEET